MTPHETRQRPDPGTREIATASSGRRAEFRARLGRQASAVLVVCAFAVACARSQPVVVLGGLNQPQDVLVGPDDTVYVGESGIGRPDTGDVIALAPDGTKTVLARLPSTEDGSFYDGAAGLALLDGTLYAASAGWDET